MVAVNGVAGSVSARSLLSHRKSLTTQPFRDHQNYVRSVDASTPVAARWLNGYTAWHLKNLAEPMPKVKRPAVFSLLKFFCSLRASRDRAKNASRPQPLLRASVIGRSSTRISWLPEASYHVAGW